MPSLLTPPPSQPVAPAPRRKRWTREECVALESTGLLDQQHLELVEGELIDKMGWLEYILVTPSHHRVHHASNPRYLDKNMGMFLIIWDQLFGTFYLPKDEKGQVLAPVRLGHPEGYADEPNYLKLVGAG